MSEEPEQNLSLELQFLPEWAQEKPQVNKYANYKGDGGDRSPRRGRRDGRRNERQGRSGREGAPRRKGPDRQKNASRGGDAKRPPRDGMSKSRRHDSRERFDDEPLPELKVVIVPDKKGVESISNEIKQTGKAYPVFQIAQLILERPERHVMEVSTKCDQGGKPLQPLFLCKMDGSVWFSEKEVMEHAFSRCFDQFYETRRTEGESPKGSYTCVAQCGISKRLLGPPNYHGYQNNLIRLHSERFSNMQFEEYKSRVVTIHDEAALDKWLEEAKWKTEYVSLQTDEPVIFPARDDARAHFERSHLDDVCESVRQCSILGASARKLDSPRALVRILKSTWHQQCRFPLQIATQLSKQFSSRGLQFFKRDKTVTYVTVARPKFLNLETTAVSEGIRRLVEVIDATEECTRRIILEALVTDTNDKSVAEIVKNETNQTEEISGELESDKGASEEHVKSAKLNQTPVEQRQVLADLHWLIHQGHEIEFANGIIETAKKPRPKEEQTKEADKVDKIEEEVAVTHENLESKPDPAKTSDFAEMDETSSKEG